MADTHDILQKVVSFVECLPGWSFRLAKDPKDMLPKLVIQVKGYDSSAPEVLRQYTINHFFPVPEATYNEASWRRWVFECCRRVMNHELGEWFRVRNERPFAALHGPGEDPYTVHEFRPVKDALTIQDGSMRERYANDPGVGD